MLVPNPRLLFYAVDGLGLGHVTRLLAIARAVRAQCPDAQLLFLTASEADSVIYQEGFAACKVPSKTIAAATGLRPQTWTKLVQTVTWNTVAAFNPAALIVDTFPAGVLHELLPLLRWDMRRVFVYRVQQPDKARDPFFQNALALYNLAVIPHIAGSEDMPVPPQMPSVWTGDIVIRNRSDALSRQAARARLGLPAEGRVLYVTFGGGGRGRDFRFTRSHICRAARFALAIGGRRRPAGTPSRPDPARQCRFRVLLSDGGVLRRV